MCSLFSYSLFLAVVDDINESFPEAFCCMVSLRKKKRVFSASYMDVQISCAQVDLKVLYLYVCSIMVDEPPYFPACLLFSSLYYK